MQPPCYITINCISSFIRGFSAIGFSGSRNPYSQVSNAVFNFLPKLAGYSGIVGVGCAQGVDQLVRLYFPQSLVFKVQPPINRKAFAIRSTRLVSWVSASSGLLIAFPSTSCPSSVAPSLCFYGAGSGTWGSVALAVGMGASVLVFIHSSCGNLFPAPKILARHFKQIGNSYGGYWWLAG